MTESTSTEQFGSSRVKRGLADMLKGGVIMDVVTAEQAVSQRTPALSPLWPSSAFPPTSVRRAVLPA